MPLCCLGDLSISLNLMGPHIRSIKNFETYWKDQLISEAKRALQCLVEKGEEAPHETIHEIRKSFKKLRAFLRLVRFDISYYKAENRFLRDLGRSIAQLRDATACFKMLTILAKKEKSQLDFDQIEVQLKNQRANLEKEFIREKNILNQVQAALENKIQEIDDWPLQLKDFNSLKKGLQKVYKRGRNGYVNALKKGTPQRFHEWRKRAKYLWHQVDMLNFLWPEILKPLAKEMHTISDLLGTDHDLTLLDEMVGTHQLTFGSEQARHTFRSLLREQQGQYRDRALVLGAKIYAETPKAFASKLETYWDVSIHS